MKKREELVGLFPVDEPRTFGWNYYKMYLTNQRIIFAKIGGGSTKSYSNKIGKIGESFINLGFLGLVGLLASRSDKSDNYENMNLEEILKADKKNFAFSYNDIKSIKLKERGTIAIGGTPPSRIIFEPIHGKKKTFDFKKDYFSDMNSVLQALAKDKLVIK